MSKDKASGASSARHESQYLKYPERCSVFSRAPRLVFRCMVDKVPAPWYWWQQEPPQGEKLKYSEANCCQGRAEENVGSPPQGSGEPPTAWAGGRNTLRHWFSKISIYLLIKLGMEDLLGVHREQIRPRLDSFVSWCTCAHNLSCRDGAVPT